MSDTVTVELIGGAVAIVVAAIGAVAGFFARQNSKQHAQAADERAKDREASAVYREQLNLQLKELHTDVREVRDLVVEHVQDPHAHGGG